MAVGADRNYLVALAVLEVIQVRDRNHPGTRLRARQKFVPVELKGRMKKLLKLKEPSGVRNFLAVLAVGLLMFTFTKVMAAVPVGMTAAPITLSWNPSITPDTAGYNVCYGPVNSGVTSRVDSGRTLSSTLFNLTAGVNYYFYVVAYNAAGVESQPSNMLYYTPPAVSKLTLAKLGNGSMQVQFRSAVGSVCRVQYAPKPNTPSAQWQTLTTATADANGNITVTDPLTGRPPMRFYRAVRP